MVDPQSGVSLPPMSAIAPERIDWEGSVRGLQDVSPPLMYQ